MKKKVAIYCRVATANQLESSQIAVQSQQHYLLQFAREHQFEVTAVYSDIGYPGHDLDRPAYKRLIADAQTGHFDAILVKNIGRLYRGSVFHVPDFPVQVISVDQQLLIHHKRLVER